MLTIQRPLGEIPSSEVGDAEVPPLGVSAPALLGQPPERIDWDERNEAPWIFGKD